MGTAMHTCYIDSLSDDLLVGGIFCKLQLMDAFRLECVSRRWYRLVHEALWPSRTHLDTSSVTGMLGCGRSEVEVGGVWRAIFKRCASSIVTLEISPTVPILEQFALALTSGRFRALEHFAFRNLPSSPCPSELNATLVSMAIKLPTLKSLALRDLPTNLNSRNLPHNFFSSFCQLEILQIQVATRKNDSGYLRFTSLPSTLKYLELKFDEGADLNNWTMMAVRDCGHRLETLRIIAMHWEQKRDCDPRVTTGLSSEALLSIAKFKRLVELNNSDARIRRSLADFRLTALQIPLASGDDSREAFATLISRLRGQLRALSITNLPSLTLVDLLAEHCGCTLEHLSLFGGDSPRFEAEMDVMTDEEMDEKQLCFPALRSLKMNRMPPMGLLLITNWMQFKDLERIHSDGNKFNTNHLRRYIFGSQLHEVTFPATLSDLYILSELLEERKASSDGGGRKTYLTYCVAETIEWCREKQLELKLPRIRIVRDFARHKNLEATLFGTSPYAEAKLTFNYAHW